VASTLQHQVIASGVSGVEVVFGVYDLQSRHVGLPAYEDPDERGHVLVSPPRDGAAYAEQAALLAGSPRISRLLYGGESKGSAAGVPTHPARIPI
jgi:hypothetical protein